MLKHRPVFTVAHNGYCFDNHRLMYWLLKSGDKLSRYFRRVTVPSTYKNQSPSTGYIIDYKEVPSRPESQQRTCTWDLDSDVKEY
eukprot:388380-Amorphochlora_amoeboformis.AAC.2